MKDDWLRASQLSGTLNIEPKLSLEETSKKLSHVLSLNFAEEQTGRYEEYPAYVAEGAGIEFVLLGAPDPKYDIRKDKSLAHQLMISSLSEGDFMPPHRVDVSALYANLIQTKTGLVCVALEFPVIS